MDPSQSGGYPAGQQHWQEPQWQPYGQQQTQPPAASSQTPAQAHPLRHSASNVSEMSPFEYHSVRPRDSIVSVDTEYRRTPQPQHHHQPPPPQSTHYPAAANDQGHSYSSHEHGGWQGWHVPFLDSAGRGYEPVSVAGNSGGDDLGNPGGDTYGAGGGDMGGVGLGVVGGGTGVSMSGSKPRMKTFRDRQQQQHHPETIPEDESIDLSLLSSAAPMGYANNYGPGVARDKQAHDNDDGPAVDLSAFDSGPLMASAPDQGNLEQYQAAEANGKLTGGLGVGWKPEATLRGEDLLAMSPAGDHPGGGWLGRTFSRKKSGMRRKNTLRDLGQYEANKRGEVIEVIIDDEDDKDLPNLPPAMASEVDLSVMTGPSTLDNTSFSSLKRAKTQLFHPEPNWKPFSMRWPYLSFLIVLSVLLAGAQEAALQFSPLVNFQTADKLSPYTYFAVKFLPTIITVAYGVLWQFTDFEVRRLEAFYQLSKPGGALAAESLNVDYITAFSFLRPFRAVRLKHHAVAISSVATVIAISLVPTLGAASVFLSPSREERNSNATILKSVEINPTWSRLLTIVFCLCAIMASVLFWMFHKRNTGLKNEVKGIAGLASMAVVSHILTDFKDLDVAPPDDIHARLKYHRYVLRNCSLAPDSQGPVSRSEQDKYERAHLSNNPHPTMLRPGPAISFVCFLVAFLVFIPVVLFSPAGVISDEVPWVMTILAVIIKLSWGSLDTDMRMMEPYYILYNRHAPPKTLSLDYTALPFGWMPIRALFNRHILMFLVGLGTVLAELLTILVTGLATVDGHAFLKDIDDLSGDDHEDRGHEDGHTAKDRGKETVGSFFISLALACLILIYMAIVATFVFVRRRHPFLPRLPNTIASVLAFIHQSKMLYDFTATERMNNVEMTRHLESIGKKYGLGWFEGRDGQTHCGVDQEELSGNYRHGMNYEAINKPWVGNWDTYEG